MTWRYLRVTKTWGSKRAVYVVLRGWQGTSDAFGVTGDSDCLPSGGQSVSLTSMVKKRVKLILSNTRPTSKALTQRSAFLILKYFFSKKYVLNRIQFRNRKTTSYRKKIFTRNVWNTNFMRVLGWSRRHRILNLQDRKPSNSSPGWKSRVLCY